MSTRRRTLLAACTALAAAPLAGCGFALRKAPDFHFQSIYLLMPASDLALQLRRQLEGTGRVRVTDDPASADVVLESLGERRYRDVLSRNADGEVREYLLRVRVAWRLRTGDGRELLPLSELEREMEQSYSESDALAKEQEAQMLFRSMQADLVQQVMRQLAAVQP